MYHAVTPSFAPGFDLHLSVTPDRLRGHIRSFKRRGYEFLTLSQAWRRIEEGRRKGRAAVLTFDDVSVPFFDYALTVLKSEGIPATVFVIAGMLTGETIQNLPGASAKPPDKAALRELVGRGHEIGSHGLTHRELTGMAADELSREVRDSRSILEDTLGASPSCFCYPRGRFDPAVQAEVEAAGYLCACTTLRGNRHLPSDRFALRRIRAGMDLFGPRFLYTATPCYDRAHRKRGVPAADSGEPS